MLNATSSSASAEAHTKVSGDSVAHGAPTIEDIRELVRVQEGRNGPLLPKHRRAYKRACAMMLRRRPGVSVETLIQVIDAIWAERRSPWPLGDLIADYATVCGGGFR